MKHRINILCICWGLMLGSLSSIWAQSDSTQLDWTIYKERGFNMTPMVGQFVPLGKAVVEEGPVIFQGQRIRNGQIYRFGLGFNLDPEGDFFHFNIRIGLGKEFRLSPKWIYYRGTDFWLFGGNENVPVESTFSDGTAGLGVAPLIGIKYMFTPYLNLATETHIFFGIASDHPLVIRIMPPVALWLNVRLPQNLIKRKLRSLSN